MQVCTQNGKRAVTWTLCKMTVCLCDVIEIHINYKKQTTDNSETTYINSQNNDHTENYKALESIIIKT